MKHETGGLTMLVILRRRYLRILLILALFCLGGLFGGLLSSALTGATVVVDPGHGGIDGGCQDGRGNLEKDLNLAISRRVADRLRQAGISASLTRRDDRELGATYPRDLAARRESARRAGARALVSLHANWCSDPAAEGALAVIPPGSPQSLQLAKAILNRLRVLGPVNQEPLVMTDHGLLGTEPFPIVLVEVGFLSNPAEAARLQTPSHQDLLARAIARGIADYLGAAGSRPPSPARRAR